MKQLLLLFLGLLVRHFGVKGDLEDLIDVRIKVLLAELGGHLGVGEEREAGPGQPTCLRERDPISQRTQWIMFYPLLSPQSLP